MFDTNKWSLILWFMIMSASCTLTISCSEGGKDYSDSEIPVDLSSYQIVDGYEVESVAAEPQIVAPVDIIFDEKGRIWVVEMLGYMTDFAGSEEGLPNGRISILEDRDGNGVIDHKTVFLDELVMPRTIGFAHGGLLYATPPELWWVPVGKNDKAGEPVLIDSAYAEGGNAEHQPNGLLYNVDNWYYNAKSNARYRFRNGKWEKEYIFLRGQWGITQDDYGILYFNDNSNQFRGDYFLPGILDQNKNLAYPPGIAVNIVKDQNLYPLQFTAVNRGYMKGVLDPETQKLRKFTAASGVLYYTGGKYNGEFDHNSFVGGPEANFIKRNTIRTEGVETSGSQTYDDHEFLISSDEMFRPVSVKMGPDGLIYIVDMHRGVIQHKTYLTNYLRKQYAERGLDTLLTAGRILRIVPEGYSGERLPDISETADNYPELLKDKNSWKRLFAQQRMVEQNMTDKIPELKALLISDEVESYTPIHAFWALEALDGLTTELILEFAVRDDYFYLPHAIKYLTQGEMQVWPRLRELAEERREPLSDKNLIYWAAMTDFSGKDVEEKVDFLKSIMEKLPEKHRSYAIHMALSQMKGKETEVLRLLKDETAADSGSAEYLANLDQKIASNIKLYEERENQKGNQLSGLQFFETNCSTCHGRDGKGIENLAPPLYQSEYIEGRDSALAMIVLHGLQGPVEVHGKTYEFTSVMPALADNTEYSDEELAAVMSFIKNAFGRNPGNISPKLVKKMREYPSEDGDVYTVPGLKKRLKEITRKK